MTAARVVRIAVGVLLLLNAGFARAEPLRILVSEFSGPKSLGKYVMTTLFFEVAKGFAAPANTEKGGWILYGHKPLRELTHDEAVFEASWPSAKADMVVWGSVSGYGGGIVVQPNLTITPLAGRRTVRPELWTVTSGPGDGPSVTVAVELPRTYYEFEPFEVPAETVRQYSSPEGLPLYSERSGGRIVDYARGAFTFRRIEPTAIQLQSRGGTPGWARLPGLGPHHSQAISFVQAMVRFMRGDWRGAIADFGRIREQRDTPNALRIDSLIYMGVAREKLGRSGRSDFEAAYALNRLDRAGAQFAIMGRIAASDRLRRTGAQEATANELRALGRFVASVRPLFPPGDPWMVDVDRLIATWRIPPANPEGQP